MDPFLIPQVIDLAGENPAKTYRQPLASGDSAAHRWEVRVVRAGAAADLTGCSAAVLARREGEDSSPTVRQPAKIAGNVASADFIPEVYALGGRILAMMVISGSDERVITAAVLRMQGKTYTTDTICDPEGTIPSLEALLARYEDMVAATDESRAATQAAQQATEETRSALTDAQAALATAQQAVTDAQGALGTAQTAADTANAAAVKIDDMTVSATPLDAGTATAELTTVDGHYHLTLGLPKGDTGATPQISVQVQTGEAGSEASVSVSGTAEEPVIHLTIPRGDAGNIENLTINGKTPDGSGAVTLTAADVGASVIRFFTLAFPASGWEEQSDGSYTQQVDVAGLTEEMNGHVDVDMSAVTASTAADVIASWAMIGRAESLDGALMLTSYDRQPTADLTVKLEVII